MTSCGVMWKLSEQRMCILCTFSNHIPYQHRDLKRWSNDVSRARRFDGKLSEKQHHIVKEENGSTQYDILAITDMDIAAKAPDWQFRAITRKGTLTLSDNGKTAHLEWDLSSDQDIMSGFSYKGRGMELSDLTEYNGHILSPDDKTGILFEIKNNKALPWVILNSGPGNTTKGMKTEWLTIKGSFLYAGGHGVEYRDENGVVFSEDQMWIKVISRRGEVRSVNWKKFYLKVREFAGIQAPGYMTHEAVQWSDVHSKWFFLPRKALTTMYDEKADEKKGTNLLITADESFNIFEIVRVGPLDHPERGFSAFSFVPGTNDNLIMALKSTEMDGRAPESFATVFDIRGQILMKDQKLGNNYKFEGIFFL
ncbi:Apyrase [Ancylostoma duodenale]|uniref:Apyrase n=1 Tax=Ancylostoma duodenale TaxID=51022 RepID=A0A0C2GQB9_9BILA|nr:Apyrase [Ancylostoma duodenale]